MVDLVEQLRNAGDAAGLDGFGVAAADLFEGVRRNLLEAKASGRSGRLGFTYRDPEVATEVSRSYPWARSLVVGAVSYMPAAGSPRTGEKTGRVARFATEDHYVPLRLALRAVAEVLTEAGYRSAVLVDDSRLVDRAAAVRAGVGWWGKSTMVITPKHGPWLLLGSVVTDAQLPVSQPMQRDCGRCDACIPACPTGALDTPGVLEATRCIAYWTQTAGTIPAEIREGWGNRIYGCDDCLEACPPGHSLLEPAPPTTSPSLSDLLTAGDDELLEAVDHWFIPRRDPDFIRRNALVALGNTGRPEDVPLAAPFLDHPRAMLRIHAAWAIGRLGGDAARLLRERRRIESDSEVLGEIESALIWSS